MIEVLLSPWPLLLPSLLPLVMLAIEIEKRLPDVDFFDAYAMTFADNEFSREAILRYRGLR